MPLRVLETGGLMHPVGGHMPLKTDVQPIAATDGNIERRTAGPLVGPDPRREREKRRASQSAFYRLPYSIGGWVAVLLAQRLTARGEKVSASLFDTTAHKHALMIEPRNWLETLNRLLEVFEFRSCLVKSCPRPCGCSPPRAVAPWALGT